MKATHESHLISVCNRIAQWTGDREIDIDAIALYIERQHVSYRDADEFASQCGSLPDWHRAMGDDLRESEATIRTHVPTLRPPDFQPVATTTPAAIDHVNHPAHYVFAGHPSGVECIEIVESLPFCLGNAVKYIYRAGRKGSAAEDYRKAVWYFRRQAENQAQIFFTSVPTGLRRWAVHDPVAALVAGIIFSAQNYNWRTVAEDLENAAVLCEARASDLEEANHV